MTAVTTPDRRHFAVIVLFASVVRAAMLWFTIDSLSADPDAYRRIACCLAETDVFGLLGSDPATKLTAQPTAFRPPLYPWLLSFLVSSDGTLANGPIAVLHWLLGVLTSAGVFCLARCLKLRLSVATCAAMLVAIDPLLLQSSSQVMTETLATALSTAGLICWVRLVTRNDAQANIATGSTTLAACLLGLTASLAYLCRPTFILWPLGITSLLIVMAFRSQDALARRLHIRSAAIVLATLSLFVGAWTWRNWQQLGKPIWATTHGGYTLLLGNNPSYYQYLHSDAPIGQAWNAHNFLERWDHRLEADPRLPEFWQDSNEPSPSSVSGQLQREQASSWNELQDDQLAYQSATATIRRQRGTFAYACLYRLLRLHSPMPLRQAHPAQSATRSPWSIYAVTVFYTLTWLSVLLGLKTLGRQIFHCNWLGVWLLWSSIAVVHTVYWTDIRMRAPLVPSIMLLAAIGLVHLFVTVLRKGPASD